MYYQYNKAFIKCIEKIIDGIKYIFADEEERIFIKHVPHYCRTCEMLYDCRNPNNKWKCYRGCIEINMRGR